MTRFLVTGGAGFIGSHIVHALVERGDEVIVLDNLVGGTPDNLPSQAQLVRGDIADPVTVDELFAAYRFEKVLHLAAFAAEGISHTVKRHNYTVNLIGSVNLVNAALTTGTRFFGFASSVAVYGDGPTPMCEDDTPVPADSYGNAKLAVERELAVTMRLQKLPFTALRMHNVYGERQNMADPYRNAVAIFLNQVLRGEPITVYGDGGQRRAFTYVGDIAQAFLAAAEREDAWGRALNLGSRATWTVLEMARAVRDALGTPDHPIMHLPARSEVRAAFTDSARARRILGDWTDTPLPDGMARTAAWARTHGPVQPTTSLRLETADPDSSTWLAWATARPAAGPSVSETPRTDRTTTA
ncbi:NAD-dependent epimerase/dehydratase family protein [Sphaerimonospora thailandensis]|uniref:NDP-sugar dehydratase or epimerase n=1 Tax=Sphaerimonospora thailandensis TaxID=795644 RepID=A0A8J3RA24_9ACTN|nr:NAD-dependent epimerase/dehydratase family protein [Sphaerimonospora thailandensis]GIH68788.1 NDP-sugar dehydratase or epimerase [Sphaerimonospora thailandensis]